MVGQLPPRALRSRPAKAARTSVVAPGLPITRPKTGTFGTLVLMSYDWDDKDAWIRNLELYQNELMPALNKAVFGKRPKAAAV